MRSYGFLHKLNKRFPTRELSRGDYMIHSSEWAVLKQKVENDYRGREAMYIAVPAVHLGNRYFSKAIEERKVDGHLWCLARRAAADAEHGHYAGESGFSMRSADKGEIHDVVTNWPLVNGRRILTFQNVSPLSIVEEVKLLYHVGKSEHDKIFAASSHRDTTTG